MSDEPDFVLIGRMRRAHGVKGEVCVEPISSAAERFQALESVLIRNAHGIREFRVEAVRTKRDMLLVKLGGINDRTSAEALAGAALGVRMQDIYPLPQDTYYLFQLVGSEVKGGSGSRIGVVEDVLNLPANDVLVVKTGAGEVLIPVTKNVIRRVDTTNKTIEIEEIDGLLE